MNNPTVTSARTAPNRAAAVVVLAVLALWVGTGTASAHAELTGSTPAADSSLTQGPQQVTLTFSEDIRDFVPTVTVTGPDGQNYATGAPTLAGPSLTQPVAELGPAGTYTAAFRIVSADEHAVTGEIPFTYAPPEATVATTSTDSTQDSASATGADPSASPTASPSGSEPPSGSQAPSVPESSNEAAASGLTDSDWHWVWLTLIGLACLAVGVIPVMTRTPR